MNAEITKNSRAYMLGGLVISGPTVRWGRENGYAAAIMAAEELKTAYRKVHPSKNTGLVDYTRLEPAKLKALLEINEARVARMRAALR